MRNCMKPNSILVQFWYNFCTIFIPDLYIFHLVFFIFTEITFPLLYFSIIYHFSSKPHSYKEGTLSGMLKVESYLDDFLFLILLMTFIHAHSLRADAPELKETQRGFDFDSCVRFSWSHKMQLGESTPTIYCSKKDNHTNVPNEEQSIIEVLEKQQVHNEAKKLPK